MRTLIFTTLALACAFVLSAQHNETHYLLKTDSLWEKETFDLPTNFAREMTLKGFEDASFPAGWSNPESDELWSYIFAWSVEAQDEIISIEELEKNLERYFDGLMDVREESITPSKVRTNALLVETKSKEDILRYSGKVRTFDNFRSKKMMTLHIMAEQYPCESQQRKIIVFRFSPKAFYEPIWEQLTRVQLLNDACERE